MGAGYFALHCQGQRSKRGLRRWGIHAEKTCSLAPEPGSLGLKVHINKEKFPRDAIAG